MKKILLISALLLMCCQTFPQAFRSTLAFPPVDANAVHYNCTVVLAYDNGAVFDAELKAKKMDIHKAIDSVMKQHGPVDPGNIFGALELSEKIKAAVNPLLRYGRISEIHFIDFRKDQ